MTTQAELIAAVHLAGPYGATADDVATEVGQPINYVTGPLVALLKPGLLRRVGWKRRGSGGKLVHIYVTPENYRPEPSPKSAPTGSVAGSSGPWPTGECRVVYRNGIKVTIGPSATFDRRHQVDPRSRPFGAGFAAVGLGRDVQTGRQWA